MKAQKQNIINQKLFSQSLEIDQKNIEIEEQNKEYASLNKKYKKTNKELRKSNKTKDKFFSIISHDLRSPFSAMMGLSNILIKKFDKYDTTRKKEIINHINQSITNTYKLVENLLTWSRTQRNVMGYKPESENLYLLSKETTDLLEQSFKNKNIALFNGIKKELYAQVDKNMILTIFRNLISNAIKFTQQNGEIKLLSNIITDKNNKHFFQITIKDNGVGISPEKQSKIFGLNKNISTKGTENEEGTGLGLILCKEFVEKHGGKIWLKSVINKGSEFSFTIPYK